MVLPKINYVFTVATLATTLGFATAVTIESRQSTSFVKTSGQQFTLDGRKFTVAGSNAYWIPQLANDNDMTIAFKDLQKAGLTTLRTWGFNEVTSPSGTYYQIWNGKTAKINTGADGLGRFDTVVAQAKAANIRLIVALTNNWNEYGGMDVYVKQLLGKEEHDLFYTDDTVKAAYRNYIREFVGRYKNEPTIMAWELANEPRCKGKTEVTTGTCTTKTITNWATEMSAYIKSIAPNHLVAVGDEGFFNRPKASTYLDRGDMGIDFADNLNHVQCQQETNKPVILEEFGVTSPYNPLSTYTLWWETMIFSHLTGYLICSRAVASTKAQTSAKERDRRVVQLTTKEILEIPPNSGAQFYRGVGKMFMQEPRSTIENSLRNQEKELTNDINNLAKKIKYHEKQLSDSQAQMRDIFHAAENR
ncbi:unnamed protein product [Rhizoctonia solani]|uniref:mannan endo-1,4-beta-mannosidase n=1 Tax=Rhizoctonia solani TaxID=456999 RepID=A0A8H3AXQ5_9AGAM|nr:unnamed protein product [Rhizoctonia solani]